MAVANASKLLSRLARLNTAMQLTPYTLVDVAQDVIEDVQRSAQSNLSGRTEQVGFDLDQFLTNISRPGPLLVPSPGVGSVGILDYDLMGTADDFERIGGVPGLYHQHTGDNRGVWRNIVYPDTELREEVARERQAVWGSKTPQWWLYENGFSGNGAYPTTPATHFVEQATAPRNVLGRIRVRFSTLFRGI